MLGGLCCVNLGDRLTPLDLCYDEVVVPREGFGGRFIPLSIVFKILVGQMLQYQGDELFAIFSPVRCFHGPDEQAAMLVAHVQMEEVSKGRFRSALLRALDEHDEELFVLDPIHLGRRASGAHRALEDIVLFLYFFCPSSRNRRVFTEKIKIPAGEAHLIEHREGGLQF